MSEKTDQKTDQKINQKINQKTSLIGTIGQWYDHMEYIKKDPENYYQLAIQVNTRRFPFIVVNDDNSYQIIFAIDQDHAEWIAAKQFKFDNPIALPFESIANFRDAKSILKLVPKAV